MHGATALPVLLVEDALNNSSLKLPQSSHKPDNTVIYLVFIIIIIFIIYWPQPPCKQASFVSGIPGFSLTT